MKDEWYGDKRDLVKWGSLLLLAEQHRLSRILQVAYYRSSTWASLEIDGVEHALPASVVAHFRDVRSVRRLSGGVQIDVVDVPLECGRTEYIKAVVSAATSARERKLVFLDPDTGLEPARGKGGPTHVLEQELQAIWTCLRPHDILALYQHQTNRNGTPWLEPKRRQFEIALSLSPGSAKVARAPEIARDVALIYISRARRGGRPAQQHRRGSARLEPRC
jgi:hypothetical protein